MLIVARHTLGLKYCFRFWSIIILIKQENWRTEVKWFLNSDGDNEKLIINIKLLNCLWSVKLIICIIGHVWGFISLRSFNLILRNFHVTTNATFSKCRFMQECKEISSHVLSWMEFLWVFEISNFLQLFLFIYLQNALLNNPKQSKDFFSWHGTSHNA